MTANPESTRQPNGCLTAAGFETLERAPVGQAPAELASHVASCERCQQRMLERSAGPRPRVKREPPPLWRTIFVVVAAILMLIGLLVTLPMLTG